MTFRLYWIVVTQLHMSTSDDKTSCFIHIFSLNLSIRRWNKMKTINAEPSTTTTTKNQFRFYTPYALCLLAFSAIFTRIP